MANFSGNINLMGFKGAKIFSNLDPQHPNQLYVAIPVSWNDIQLSQDGRYANARVFMAETNDKFRQACIQRKHQIAENIFEWWISGKSYKKWYVEKFLQLRIFKDE